MKQVRRGFFFSVLSGSTTAAKAATLQDDAQDNGPGEGGQNGVWRLANGPKKADNSTRRGEGLIQAYRTIMTSGEKEPDRATWVR
jgi:hypothetical protein